jgi:Tfp pilus assembly protein PilF/GTPase SAR1 family protein
MSSSLPIYVPRETIENEFLPFLAHEHKFIWSIQGVGGIGKTTLMNRFYEQTKETKQCACFLDYPNHTLGKISGLDLLLQNLLTNQCDNFDKIKKIIEKKYRSVAQKLGNISAISEHIPVNSITSLIAELDQDEAYTKELGLVWGTLTDTIKLTSKLFNRDKKDEIISTNPELHLLTALAADFEKKSQGILFIDTYEKLKDIRVTTTLQIIGNEVVSRREDYELSFEEYSTIVVKFLKNQREKSKLKIIVAGRDRLNAFAGESLFVIKQSAVNQFEPEQIIAYLEEVSEYLDDFTLPEDDIIADIHETTNGNPLILEFLVQFIIVRYGEDWTWREWQAIQEEFKKSDDEFGLIYYLTERIASHISGWEHSLWKLIIPLQLTEEVAEVLYPKTEATTIHGKAYCKLLQQKGILRKGKGADANMFYILDEVKASLEAYVAKSFAKNGKHWTNHELVLQTNQELANLHKNHKNDPIIQTRYSYHQLQTIADFEEKSGGMSIKEFTALLLGSIIMTLKEKVEICNEIQNYKKDNIFSLILYLKVNLNYVLSFASEEFIRDASVLAFQGKLPENFENNETFLVSSLEKFPDDPALNGSYARFLHKNKIDFDAADRYYNKSIQSYEKNANVLNNYAEFLKNIRKDYDQAEAYYLRAIEADESNSRHLGNYAMFLDNIRKDFDQAEVYYKKAIAADNNNARQLSNYALFLHNIRMNYDQAEEYYKKAVLADGNCVRHLGNYAFFFHDIRKDYDKAVIYYRKALAINPKNLDLHMCLGFLYFQTQKLDLAKKYLQESIKLGSLDIGNMNLGNILFAEKQPEKAFEKYKLAIQNFKDVNVFFEGLDDDFQYLQQYGVTEDEFIEMKAKLKAYAASL